MVLSYTKDNNGSLVTDRKGSTGEAVSSTLPENKLLFSKQDGLLSEAPARKKGEVKGEGGNPAQIYQVTQRGHCQLFLSLRGLS